MIGIYKITNIKSNKVYIGQSINIKSRKTHHFSDLRGNRHPNRFLQHSWNKYGEMNFKFKILEYCSKQQLDEKEVYWINYYKSNNQKYGYNLESGGHKNKQHNERSKKLMSIKSKNAIRTSEWRYKIGKAHKGKVLSKSTKEKIRQYNLGKKYSTETNLKKGCKGELNPSAKLTNEQVRHIKLAMYCGMNKTDVLDTFGVNKKSYYRIRRLETWSHIAPETNNYIDTIYKYNSKVGDGNV